MRAPLDSMFVTNPFGQAGYGVFGKHAGVDLRAAVGTSVYAPADGVITERYVGTGGIQVLSMRIGALEHRFLHLSSMFPTIGESVKQGQLIAKSGNSGNVAAHLHWDVRKAGTMWNRSFSDYVNPLTLIQGGSEVFGSDQEVIEAYLMLRGVAPTAGEIAGWRGQSKQRFFQVGKAEADQYRQALADVRQALINEQAKPAKEVIKEVIKIVEKPIEVIREVPVEVVKEPKWLEATINFIRGVLRIK